MDSLSVRPGNGSQYPSAPPRRRRWGGRLLGQLRHRWLREAAVVLLGAVILGLLAVLLISRI